MKPTRDAGERAMSGSEVAGLLAEALEGRRLLDHPFYRRWEAGGLADGELASYASQYRFFEEYLPVALDTVAKGLPEGGARRFVLSNLADELGPPVSHLELFSAFEHAVGARAEPAGPAVTELVSLYRDAATGEPAEALAVIAAYEIQASEIAATKSAGLRDHYRVSEAGREFWDVHASIEADHAQWTIDALRELGCPELVRDAARRSADAWWRFLDERELAAV